MKRKMCLGGGLLLIASSAIISLAACSSFNLHKDNVIRNAADNTITVNGGRNFKYFDPSTDTLTEGNYLIGGEIGTDLYFISSDANKNLPVTIYDSSKNYFVFNIVKDSSNEALWNIKYGENYLYASSSSSNNLKIKSELDDNGRWTYDSVKSQFTANGNFTRNVMRFNSDSELVSCYAPNNSSRQKSLVLYKEEVGTQYTVSFETGVDGMTVNPQKISEGKYATAPDTLINGEQAVTGWYVKGDKTETPVDFKTYAINEDTTFVAIWTETTEKIVQFFDEDKTTLIEEVKVKKGETVTESTKATKAGYQFDAWVDENGKAFDFSTPITKMTKLYATYKNLDVTTIANVITDGSKTAYFRVEGEVTTILNNETFTIDDGTSGIICFDKISALGSKLKIGNKIAITGKYTLYRKSPELTNFLADTLKIIENDETISSTMYKDLSSIDFSDNTNLGKLVKLEKFALPADLTIAKQAKVVSDDVTLYVSDVTSLPSGTTFKQGQLVNITGYTTLFDSTKEVIITSISAYNVASDLVNSKSIDWVSFKYKSYEDGTYDSFSDIALNYTITMEEINAPTFTEGGVILIKGTSEDWNYESTMSELPTANNSTIFVQKFDSIEKSAIGAINPELSNQFTMRISFGSLENAKAHYETSFIIAPYFKVNGTYHIGNKIETSIKKAIANSLELGCKEEVLVALANTLAN